MLLVSEEESVGEVGGLVLSLEVGEAVDERLGFILGLAEGDVEGDVADDKVDADVVDAVGAPVTSSLPSNTVTYTRSLVNVPFSTVAMNLSTINCDKPSPLIVIRIGTQ